MMLKKTKVQKKKKKNIEIYYAEDILRKKYISTASINKEIL